MTENTPTPADPIVARLRKLADQIGDDENYDDDPATFDEWALLRDAAAALEAVTAERDALAAILAEVRAWLESPMDSNEGNWEALKRILSKLPADALAARDARVLREAAYEFAEGAWNDAFAAGPVEDDVSAVQATEQWFRDRADRIEREVQR